MNREELSMTKQEVKQQWKDRIAAYRASGLSQAAWCKENNVSLRQLSYWLKKEGANETPLAASTKWLPVEISSQSADSEKILSNNSLHIKIGPAVVEVKPGFNQKLLLDVVRTLRTIC